MSKKHSDKQIGGEHYKHMKIQPTEFISVNQIEAHYIKDNKIENWKLSKFDVSKHDLGFINTRDLTLKTRKFKQILLNCILK